MSLTESALFNVGRRSRNHKRRLDLRRPTTSHLIDDWRPPFLQSATHSSAAD